MYSLFAKHFVNQMDLKQLHILIKQKHKQKKTHPTLLLNVNDSRQTNRSQLDCQFLWERQAVCNCTKGSSWPAQPASGMMLLISSLKVLK